MSFWLECQECWEEEIRMIEQLKQELSQRRGEFQRIKNKAKLVSQIFIEINEEYKSQLAQICLA